MNDKHVVLIGGGEHARVVADIWLSQGRTIQGYFDLVERPLYQLSWLGDYRADKFFAANAIISIGNNHTRKKLTAQVKHHFDSCIHNSVLFSQHSTHGEGCMMFHQSIVQAGGRLGNHVIVNTAAQIDHDCRISDFVHVAPGAVLCGNVTLGEGVLVGAGAVLLPGIKVGAWATIGAGAVVTRNVPEGTTVVGNPARPKKTVT